MYDDELNSDIPSEIEEFEEDRESRARPEKPARKRHKDKLYEQAIATKKPVWNKHTNKFIYPTPASLMPASGIPSGGEASGIPARGKPKFFGLQRAPTEEWEQNNLAKDLLDWAQTEEARDIQDFATSRNMSPYRFDRIKLKNDYFAECMEVARSLIGSRMREAARTRKEDGNVIMKLLPLYDQEYRDLLNERARQLQEAQRKSDFIIYGMTVESSPMVPELPKSKIDIETEGE
jgi:hypothetical protein